MVTNFFCTLAALHINGDWRICIKQCEDGRLIVSVLLTHDAPGGNACNKSVPPMVLNGTAEELDNGFFTAIQEPAMQTSRLFRNMEQYSKALEDTQKNAKKEQEKNNKGKKADKSKMESRQPTDKANDHYEQIMKAVDDLEAQKKYKEAIDSLPPVAQYPQFAEQINKRSLELLQKNISPGLF